MANWAAGFGIATEAAVDVFNMVLDRYLKAMKEQLKYTARIGGIGSFSAELLDLSILEVEDTPPVGGVETDVSLEAHFKLRFLGINWVNTNMLFTIRNLEIDLTKTPAGLPKGLMIKNTSNLSLELRFPGAHFIMRCVLNMIFAPLITFGVWMAIRIIRKFEIVIWELVDTFSVLGITYAPNSPLLTAQKAILPSSVFLASDFNLITRSSGRKNELAHFLPPNTNFGAVVHEYLMTAAVQIGYRKGWLPSKFKQGRWTIYVNVICVGFKQDTIVVSGILKAVYKRCWCRVKVRVKFYAAVRPRVVNIDTINPIIVFSYDAVADLDISTYGMLTVLGVIMFAPVFLSLTFGLSFLINIGLSLILPFIPSWNPDGSNLHIKVDSAHFSGISPFFVDFPLRLSGFGVYDLSRFTHFNLPGGGPLIDVGFTDESLSVQEDELRVAAELK